MVGRLFADEVLDEEVAAEYLEQHAGDSHAEVLCRKEEVAFHSPFAKCAENLACQYYCKEQRDGDAVVAVCEKSGSYGKHYGFQDYCRQCGWQRHTEQQRVDHR